MIETKAIEVRDRATFIPMLATRMIAESFLSNPPEHMQKSLEAESYLLRRAGYDQNSGHLILFCKMSGGPSCYDPHDWTDSRTRPVAHDWIANHWDEIRSGDVIDVEFILGETKQPKVSEREECPL